MPGIHTFYEGSHLLAPLVPFIGFDTDKLNLVFCQFLSLGIAWIFYKFFPPKRTSRTLRLFILGSVGIGLCFFCYGGAVKHIFGLIFTCYALLHLPVQHVHRAVFAFAMGYLVFIHWYRWYLLSNYYIDVTGPMMIMVQKVTVIAFSLHDGSAKKPEELNEVQRREALRDVPSVLDYLGYLFQFQTVLTGPLIFYTDFLEFINGDNIRKVRKALEKEEPKGVRRCGVDDGKHGDFLRGLYEPTPYLPAWRKSLFAIFCMALLIKFGSSSDPAQIVTPRAWQMSWPTWLLLFWFVIFMQRVQYYYAWSMADAICNLSGFGFHGFAQNGEPKWDLATNVDAWKVETALSFKETLDGWNLMTMYWLRRIAYDRVPKNYRTICTYLLSAVWHGFFMGYYLCFFTGAMLTVGARMTRRCIRHYFQRTLLLSRFYDLLTFLATKFALAYATFPFVTMHLNPGLQFYRRFYFFLHLLSLFAILALPRLLPPPKSSEKKQEKTE